MNISTIVAGMLVVMTGTAVSPYAGQEQRAIKALSAQEIEDYLAGKGMGFAKAAELNRYPGPAHVLELSAGLGLSAEQRARTQAVFGAMQREAARLGRELVEEERALDAAFGSGTITAATLEASLDRIARLQARIRRTHLAAHLEQARILTAEQIAAYVRLRGYEDGAAHGHSHKH